MHILTCLQPIRGADINCEHVFISLKEQSGLKSRSAVRRMVAQYAQPPAPELPQAAEELKSAANVCFVFEDKRNLHLTCTLQDLFKAGQYSEAVGKYSEALEITPDSAVLLTNRSAAYLKAQDAEKALQDAKLAVKVTLFCNRHRLVTDTLLGQLQTDPEWSKAWQRLAEALEAASSEQSNKEAIIDACKMRARRTSREAVNLNFFWQTPKPFSLSPGANNAPVSACVCAASPRSRLISFPEYETRLNRIKDL